VGAPDHKQRSRAAFDRQAPTYDTAGFGRHARRLHDEVVAAAESFQFAAVLDVGCGTGATLEAIALTHPHVCASGIDLSEEMIARARTRLTGVGDRPGGPIDLRVADAEHLPLRDEAVDLVVCVDSLHHYPDPAAALAEMRRVTRSSGGLVIGEWRLSAPLRQAMNWLLPKMPEGDVRVYTGQELTELAEAAGYSAVRCRPAGVRGQLLTARR
jgi:ubiquinone/menaquinone biosynthesis C-methylase UbiE